MQQIGLKCIKVVGDKFICCYCNGTCIKYGKTKTAIQRYSCKICKRIVPECYSNKAYDSTTNNNIAKLVKEGCGIRSISRLLTISTTTVLKRIVKISKEIIKPVISFNKEYEVDELRTFYKNKSKLLWVVYALERGTNKVIDFAVGNRTIKTLKLVTETVVLSHPKAIYTDRLNLYQYLLPSSFHHTRQYSINHIERHNLNMRTHLKRLNRRSICFSKSKLMLEAYLKIYFWLR